MEEKNKKFNFSSANPAESFVVPEFCEKITKKYVYAGNDNLYPNYLLSLANNSAKHNAILVTKTDIVAGEGIAATTDAALTSFIANAQGEEDLSEIIKKSAFDLNLYGYCFLQIIWAKNKNTVAAIHYIDSSKIRFCKKEKEEDAQLFAICSDWKVGNFKTDKVSFLPEFSRENIKINSTQIYFIKQHRPSLDFYSLPDYVGAVKWIELDNMISNYHLNNVNNSYNPSLFLTFYAVPTDEEMGKIVSDLENNYKGSNNAGKVFFAFADNKDTAPTITPLTLNDSDERYVALQQDIKQNLLTGHRVTSGMLLGIAEAGSLAGKQELQDSFEIFQKTVISPKQKLFEYHLSKLAAINGAVEPLKIIRYKLTEDPQPQSIA
jgi:hypothetical protein